jgi:hypothetical protein
LHHTGSVAWGEYAELPANPNFYPALAFVGCAMAEVGPPLGFEAVGFLSAGYATAARVCDRWLSIGGSMVFVQQQ